MSSTFDRFVYSFRWLRRLLALWRNPNRRFLAFPPGHFASPLPDHTVIEQSYPRIQTTDAIPGMDLNLNEQIELLEAIAPLAMRIEFPTEQHPGFRYHFENDFFTYGDALLLSGMIQHVRPRRIIEVGSGYSSALMLDVRDRASLDTKMTFIEPYPVRLNALMTPNDRQTCDVIEKPVQDVPLKCFQQLEANDILFVDSSHVAKIASDVNHLIFEVFPRLKPGVIIQIHDIFWPFEYPKHWYDLGWAWNEAYVVRALLLGGKRYRVRLFPSYLEAMHREELRSRIPLALHRAKSTPKTGASSLWIQVAG